MSVTSVGRALLMTLAFACACERREQGGKATVDAGPALRDTARVRVDPGLVVSGRIVVAPVARHAMRGELRVPAEVVPSESGVAEVGVLVDGRVGSIDVREGDAVKRGQVLAWVDSPEAARVAADVIRARGRIMAATRKLERQLGLEQDRATSAAAVDEARMEVATAEADAAAARTLLTSLGIPEPPAPAKGTLTARVPVRSPIDGVVVERMLPLGAAVTADKTLFRVVARDHVMIDARWTDVSAPSPIRDAVVKIVPRGAEAGTSCTGKVVATLGVVDERTRARRVRIAPDAPCAVLVPGAYVDVAFASAEPGGAILAVPRDAVVDVRGASTVFVEEPSIGTFAVRVVRVGRRTADDVAIDEGVKEGERIVVTGAVLLKGELLRSELESP